MLGPEGPLGVMLASRAASARSSSGGRRGSARPPIARLLADETDLHFVQISAIFTGVPELRRVFDAARHRRANGQGTLLFVDEIHRFNKAQQDSFLPHMEDGTILLVGATTENPSFELNAALLSRAQVFVLDGWTCRSGVAGAARRGGSWAAPCRSTARRARRCWRWPTATGARF